MCCKYEKSPHVGGFVGEGEEGKAGAGGGNDLIIDTWESLPPLSCAKQRNWEAS